MVAANNLPIYKVAYDLFGVVMDAVRNMPRDVKQLVGSRVATEAMDIAVGECHVGWFDIDMCDRVVAVIHQEHQ
ncbi:hypothetical protein [Burkholderia pseudomallei]|uniref:hypothetical protein n=1 Tax=Burkholderia pseudomallei TaxID=28450 RepID=UPI0021F7F859|nr:hypothetical protein [Burkholderia pseudomallei]MCW0132752.1 hypothetical protein [Burkholderia pseudomallei]CAJ7720623.1 Uncharacterised protein [Burkholderia pseudomallei]